MKARAPGWISDEVRKQYNIKKSEIMPAKKAKVGKPQISAFQEKP